MLILFIKKKKNLNNDLNKLFIVFFHVVRCMLMIVFVFCLLRKDLSPPPGSYNLYQKSKILGDGFKSNFLSKTPRYDFKVPKWSWFE